jgi:hypothetical protein
MQFSEIATNEQDAKKQAQQVCNTGRLLMVVVKSSRNLANQIQ